MDARHGWRCVPFQPMTASWGGVGYLWRISPWCSYSFVRNGILFELIERCDCFTLSFLCEEYREAYKVCGSRSGRDTDKVKEAGLVPFVTPLGNVTFEQSCLTLECRKSVHRITAEERFIDKSIYRKWYGGVPRAETIGCTWPRSWTVGSSKPSVRCFRRLRTNPRSRKKCCFYAYLFGLLNKKR